MYRILDAEGMRICDRTCIESGTPSPVLMERAAEAVEKIACEKFNPAKTLVVVGSGNNGGDGLISALALHRMGYTCHVMYAGGSHHVSSETSKRLKEAEIGCVPFVKEPVFSDYTLIIDAILGTGLSAAPDEDCGKIIKKINVSGVPVLAVDIPSGISADTGRAYGEAVMADATVTMQTYKRGLVLSDGVNHSGKVYVADIGISTDIIEDDTPLAIGESDLSLIPKREVSSHKGTFGRVLVIGSSHGMCGAAFLSALAAYRSGAGIVELFVPEENRAVLQTLLPEAIVTTYDRTALDTELLKEALSRATATVIGPGLSKDECAVKIVKETFANIYSPVIVDADALNIVAENMLTYPTDVPVIVTPHVGEASRLVSQKIDDIVRDPLWYCQSYAAENEVICVLKGARTVICDGKNVFINTSGCPALAKGGSGDVLTGVIAGMLCQDLSPVGAAALGVYVHGAAGEIVAERLGEFSPLAREVADSVAEVLKKAEGKYLW